MGDSSAGGPLGGFLWQLRRALLGLLGRDFGESIEIEKHDDICVVDIGGQVLTATQAKHSLGTRRIGPRSAEFWNTLRVWAALRGKVSSTTKFVLATNCSLQASLLPLADGDGGDPSKLEVLQQTLDDIAETKPNKKLTECYDAWIELSEVERSELLSRASILAEEANLAGVSRSLQQAVRRHHIRESDLERVAQSVEGWFIRLVSERLTPTGCKMYYEEAFNFLDEEHRKYLTVAAPPEPDDSSDTVPGLRDELLSTEATFLRQLELLAAEADALEIAASFYARARVAREHWLDRAAVTSSQLTMYVSQLLDHWRTESVAAKRSLAPSEEARRSCGWVIYDRCMDHQAPFGPSTAPKYLTVGSYHMLANEPQIGWHPDYNSLLKADDDN